jgi:hypothetical protein
MGGHEFAKQPLMGAELFFGHFDRFLPRRLALGALQPPENRPASR